MLENVSMSHGILYNCQGQAITEQAYLLPKIKYTNRKAGARGLAAQEQFTQAISFKIFKLFLPISLPKTAEKHLRKQEILQKLMALFKLLQESNQ